MLPPGSVGVDYSPCEQAADKRPSFTALALLGVCNSFSSDFCLRLYVSLATVNFFSLTRMAVPSSYPVAFLAHSALCLTCNHAGYAPLSREQLGEAGREAGTACTWPVLSGDEARWAVCAAIAVVVAHASGLTRDQYAHVLSTFSHSSYKDAPRLGLAAFDELQSIGLEAFTKKHDPYWDIPLNESLPQPVIDLPIETKAEGRSLKAEVNKQSQMEMFTGQTTAAPPGNGTLFIEQPAATTKKTRKKN